MPLDAPVWLLLKCLYPGMFGSCPFSCMCVSQRAMTSGMCVEADIACLRYSILGQSPAMFRCHTILPGLTDLSLLSLAWMSLSL